VKRRFAVALLVALAATGAAGAGGETLSLMYPVASPDGSQIAWVEGFSWKIWESSPDGTGAHVLAPAPTTEGISDMDWTGRGLVVDSNFTLFLLRPGAKPRKLEPAGFTFTAGGTRVASGAERAPGPYVVTDTVTGRQWRMGNPKVVNNYGALSPDGVRVAWTAPGGVWIGKVGAIPHRLAAAAACPNWSPDGRSISFMRLFDLRVISASGGRSRLLVHKAGGCQDVRWSRDSTQLTYSGPRGILVVDLATGTSRRLPASLGDTFSAAWSSDGSALLVTARPTADTKQQINCTNLWRIDAKTLRGSVVEPGCP
jgi:hypothetical protein